MMPRRKKMKKTLSVLLTVCMMLSLRVTAVPAVSASGGTLSGAGTQSDPFLIDDANDWEVFAANVASGVNADGYYQLAGDVSLGSFGHPVSATVGTAEHPFTGTFDGAGYTLDAWIDGQSAEYTAPFRVISGAAIRDLTVTGTIYCGDFGAGIVGLATGSSGQCTIEDCTFAGMVSHPVSVSGQHIGGIVGYAADSELTLRGCVVSGRLNSVYYCFSGGLVGWSAGASLTFDDCFFCGTFGDTGGVRHPVSLYEAGSATTANVSDTYYLGGYRFRTDSGWECGYVPGTSVVTSVPDGMIGTPVTAANGETYYTVAPPAGLSEDPGASSGTAGVTISTAGVISGAACVARNGSSLPTEERISSPVTVLVRRR